MCSKAVSSSADLLVLSSPSFVDSCSTPFGEYLLSLQAVLVEAISLQNQALHQAELAASLCFSVVESEASAIAPLARQPTGCAEAAPSQNGGGTGPGGSQQMAHTADAAANGGKGAFSVNTGASGCGNSAEGAGLQEESSDSSADGTGARPLLSTRRSQDARRVRGKRWGRARARV
eukprot:124927-Pleurochrysis_carterae.AAC.2